ncbi:MAG: MtrB/PioB family outer membrane beta-barrel protein [Deltaproteobacteria bacterium]|nr:MtrB/PioB family outer membrane beta-barrel protein [Deltaproteobacteria bacterium]
MRFYKKYFSVLFCLVGILFSMRATAGPEVFKMKSSGEINAGGRFYLPGQLPRTQRAEYEEYRDLPQQFYLENLNLNLESKDQQKYLDITATEAGAQDQNYSLTASELGLYRFEFEWDQTPHIFSTDGRMLGTTTSPGVYTLPTPRPTGNDYNNAPIIDKIAVRWDTARFLFSYDLGKYWDVKGEYKWIDKSGDRPMGMAFGSPGINFREILEPVDQNVHNVRFTAGMKKEKYQLQFSYDFSLFQNALNRVISDNPLAATNGAFVPSATGGNSIEASGQTSLPPGNMANTWNFAGGVNLPMNTRINSSFSYSLRQQNDSFLPHTNNPNIPSGNLALPKSGLDGQAMTLLYNFSVTNRPADSVKLTTKYRYFHLSDSSNILTFPSHVVNDRTLVNSSLTAERFPFDKHNASMDAHFQILDPLEVTVGMGWERWDRSPQREAQTTDEYAPHISMDITPSDWTLMRVTYTPSIKTVAYYNVELIPAQEKLMRKFDEASRDRQKVDFFTQFTPLDIFQISFNGGIINDYYRNSVYGLQNSQTWSVGTDLSWKPFEPLTIFGGYVREQYSARQASQYREPTILENTRYAWVANTNDIIDTVRVGVDVEIIPNKLTWSGNWDLSREWNRMYANNPQTPTGGTAAQNASATASDFPAITSTLNRLESDLRYNINKSWNAKVAYVFDDFHINDFRTNGLLPATQGDIFLGNELLNYAAHMVVMTVGYRFD